MEQTQVFVSGGSTLVLHASHNDTLYVCSKGILKVFDLSKPEHEPEVLDVIEANSFTISQGLALIASATGECRTYDLHTLKEASTLYRSPLALTDAVFTHGGTSVICGGLDAKLELIDARGSEHAVQNVLDLPDQISYIAYNDVGDLAAVSLAGGDLAVYSYSTPEPSTVKVFKGLLPEVTAFATDELDDDLDDDIDDDLNDQGTARTTSRADWHPEGDLLAVPTKSHDIVVYDRNDFAPKHTISRHKSLVAFKWSPNGKYLASVDVDKHVDVWELASGKSVKTYDIQLVPYSLSWNRKSDEIVVGTTNGNIVTIPFEVTSALELEAEEAGEDEEEQEDEPDDLEINHDETGLFGSEDDFIVDDDGAGYVQQEQQKKRTVESLAQPQTHGHKHRKVEQIQNFGLKPYSPGSTPWATNRRYLTINPVGYAWAVKQEGHNTVTVTFFDRGANREYHFRDFSNCDIAALNEDAIVLASSSYNETNESLAKVIFKTNDQSRSWEREIGLNSSEFITTVSLSKNAVFVCTSTGFVRRYSLYGRLERMERMPPVIACINSEKYLLTVVCTSPTSFTFNLQDLDGRYLQRNEPVPIDTNTTEYPIRGLFFSSDGDPCIMGQDNILCVLSRWRDPLQATWIPVLDAVDGLRKLASGKVSAWPLGLFKDQFNFIVVRGGNYPSFPLTLPSEMPIHLPVSGRKPEKKDEDEDEEAMEEESETNIADSKAEADEEFMRCIIMAELLNDAITNDDVEDGSAPDRLAELSVQYDTSLLKQLGQSCNEGDVQDAFYLATKLRADRALAAAAKIAERLELAGLMDKINRLREARMEMEE